MSMNIKFWFPLLLHSTHNNMILGVMCRSYSSFRRPSKVSSLFKYGIIVLSVSWSRYTQTTIPKWLFCSYRWFLCFSFLCFSFFHFFSNKIVYKLKELASLLSLHQLHSNYIWLVLWGIGRTCLKIAVYSSYSIIWLWK